VILAGRPPAISTRHTIPAGKKNVMGRDLWHFDLREKGCVFERMLSWNAQLPPSGNHLDDEMRAILPQPGHGPELSPPTTGESRWNVQIDWVLQGGDAMTYAAEVDVRCPKGF
jgi:hypothetical protein